MIENGRVSLGDRIENLVMIRPENGGVAHVARSCAVELRARGVTVTELVGSEHGSPAIDGLRVMWRFRRLIRSADAIHLEVGRTALSTFWIGAWVALLRRDLVTVLHDGPSIVKSPGSGLIRTRAGCRDAFAHQVLAPLLNRSLRALLRSRTRCWLVFSQRARDDLFAAGFGNVLVLPHGADPPTASTPPSQCKTVVFAGYIAQSKGIDVLLEAWDAVAPRSCLQLQIIGGHQRDHESYSEDLRQRIHASELPVVWSGWVTDEVLTATIAEAALVVLPYRMSNPVSGILVRAMVEGRPVIATSVPAFTDMIEDGVTGLIVEPDDIEGLAAAILSLADDPAERDAYGRAAAIWSATRFTWSAQVDTLEIAYNLKWDRFGAASG